MISRRARRVKRENAAAHILGCTCVNDVTAGELRKIAATPMMFHAKAFATFAPFGPVVATDIHPQTSTPNAASTASNELRLEPTI